MPTRFLFPQARGGIVSRVFQAFVLTSIEAFLAFLCLISGLPVLLDPGTFALTVSRTLGAWFAYPWGAGMLLGGSMTLFGIGKENFRIERSGIAVLGAVAIIYAIALASLWPVSWFVFSTYCSFAIAMVARYWVLGKLLDHENEFKRIVFKRITDGRERKPDVD